MPNTAADSQPTFDVAIIGGGLAGLTCALALSHRGLNVAVFEASSRLCGRAQSWTDVTTGDPIDLGPHIFLTQYRNTLALLDRLGTGNRIVWEMDRLIRLREGKDITDMSLKAFPPPLHLAPSMTKVRAVSWRDKFSNRKIMQLAMHIDESMVEQLDSMSAMDMLIHAGVTPRFIQWFWATVCLTVLNVPLERCSAGALLRIFAQLVGRKTYSIGFAACGLGELFVPEACRQIEARGGRVYLDAPVQEIACSDSQVEWLLMRDGSRIRAKHYVSTVPPRELSDLLAPRIRDREPFNHLQAFEPSPYISSYLWFDRKLGSEKFWAFIHDDTRLNSDFYDLSNIRYGWGDRPSVITSNIIFSHQANHLSDADIVKRTHEEIIEALPAAREARIRHAVVNRVPMAVPCPTPGIEKIRPQSVTPIKGLLLAGDWTRTHLPSCMEGAVYSGLTAAETVLEDRGQSEQLTLPVKQLDGFVRAVNTRPTSTSLLLEKVFESRTSSM